MQITEYMRKYNIIVEYIGDHCFHLHTPDYKKWYYMETKPEPTITDLSGYPVPSIFNVVHKLKDGKYFICGIKAFKNLPVPAREAMLNKQLKRYGIMLNSTDTTNALMSIPVIAEPLYKPMLQEDFMTMDDFNAVMEQLREKYKHTDFASYYPVSPEAARKVFLYVMKHANNDNCSREYPLPPYVAARIRKHWIDGHTYILLDSYDSTVAVWDVENHILIYTAEKVMPLKHVTAFSKWANGRVHYGIPIKEIKI